MYDFIDKELKRIEDSLLMIRTKMKPYQDQIKVLKEYKKYCEDVKWFMKTGVTSDQIFYATTNPKDDLPWFYSIERAYEYMIKNKRKLPFIEWNDRIYIMNDGVIVDGGAKVENLIRYEKELK